MTTEPISDERLAEIRADAERCASIFRDFSCEPEIILGLLSRLDKAEGRDRTQATFEVYQDGAPVAMASGPRERAYAEAMHYVAVYGQDGLPIELYEHVPVALPPPTQQGLLPWSRGWRQRKSS